MLYIQTVAHKFSKYLRIQLKFLCARRSIRSARHQSQTLLYKIYLPGRPITRGFVHPCIYTLWEFRVQILTRMSAVLTAGFSQSPSKRTQNSITDHTTIASFYILVLSNSLFPNYFLIVYCTVYIRGVVVVKHTVSEYDI